MGGVDSDRLRQLRVKLGKGTEASPVRLGRYDVVGPLGRGGMGTVFLAEDRARGARVALKTLHDIDQHHAMGLKREFRVVADVSHPNLAAVYELACEEGLWFFTMELIDGVHFTAWTRGDERLGPHRSALAGEGSMPVITSFTRDPELLTRTLPELDVDRVLQAVAAAARHRPVSPLSPVSPGSPTPRDGRDEPLRLGGPEAAEASPPVRDYAAIRAALAELIQGIRALHRAGLCHGDLKSTNVLVRPDGRVVLVDFGLARTVDGDDSLLGRRQVVGTPAYMAPEQMGDSATGGQAADWYSVGVMIYETLTGLRPFPATSLVGMFFQKSYERPPAPSELVPDVPADLSDVCMALLRPDPLARPDGEQLEAAFAGDGASVAAASPARPAFVGRRAELERLEAAYSLARSGHPIVVAIEGPSGIGKSATVAGFLEGVRTLDRATVLAGRCYERESVPYKAFDGIIDRLAALLASEEEDASWTPRWPAELVQAFPALGTVRALADRAGELTTPDPVEQRRRAFASLADALAGLASGRPLVVSIDDLQWSDADSGALLRALLDQFVGTGVGIMMIVAYRDGARENPALEPWFSFGARELARQHLVEVPLGPLDPADAAELARATVQGLSAGQVDAETIVREGQGVPLFIEELVRYAAVHGGAGGVEPNLDAMIADRAASLPAPQRALLEVAVVAETPTSQGVLFEAAGLDAAALPALLALRGASMLNWSGAGADDEVSTYHDRVREAVAATLSQERRADCHLSLARALRARFEDQGAGPWVFDAVRHYAEVAADRFEPAERAAAARLALQAGRSARLSGAFPLAFGAFEAGRALIDAGTWRTDYPLALALVTGAAETAYLSAEWEVLEQRLDEVKAEARSPLDRVKAWEVEIDAAIGQGDFRRAVGAAREALAGLGATLPADPTDALLGQAFGEALQALQAVGPAGFVALDDVTDPVTKAAMRIRIRVSPAAYFSAPKLLPILACQLIMTSVERGLSTATPYALGLFGIVLNTLGMYEESHAWGDVALQLLGRWEDRSLEACTRHVVQNLVTNWLVPLRTTLPAALKTFDIGRETGDYEYASYSAHAWVHNAWYSGAVPLGELSRRAGDISEQLRALGEVNALHVHLPFERGLACLTGESDAPARLDGAGYDEDAELRSAAAAGSKSGQVVILAVMGYVRLLFGSPEDALECFDRARALFDAAPSVWHQPIVRQQSVVAAALAWEGLDEAARAARRAMIEECLASLRDLAARAPMNFAHKVALMEGAARMAEGDRAGALGRLEEAADGAAAEGWLGDEALACELAARCGGDTAEWRDRARDAYARWGALEKVRRLDTAPA